MRKEAAALAAIALTAAACGAGGGVRVEGQAPPPESRGPVYVVAYMGDALQRPSDFALTEFSSMNGVRWDSWGDERAVGRGELRGTWCLPGCEAKGLPATITLTRLTRLERTAYYARFTVTSGQKIKDDLTDQRLEVPPR
ncbi:hypothetical protein ACIBEJ_18865 [Nonomuraea sp. NPDC050790]|uniref:hypothetical protein n=1 Tax=Nonomuraea sp. NPDC050790 TaxID=3364371 RepID=UPI0037920066